MQLKQFHNIATKVKKGATTFGALPDWLETRQLERCTRHWVVDRFAISTSHVPRYTVNTNVSLYSIWPDFNYEMMVQINLNEFEGFVIHIP